MLTATDLADVLGETGAATGDAYPLHCFPDRVRSFFEAVASSMQVDVSAVGTLALPIMAGCIGNAARVRIKPGWSEPSVLWSCCVMSSGQRKTPVVNAVTKPLHTWQQQQFDDFELQLHQYRTAYEHYELKMKEWRKNPEDDPPSPPVPPVCRRIVTNDTTIEGLARLLVENARGMIIVRDELAGLFSSLNQYKTTGDDESKLLELYGASPLIIDRRSSSPLRVPQAACSICGGIQPAILARILSPERFENGMAARLLYAMPQEQPRSWTDTGIHQFNLAAWEEIIFKLLGIPLYVPQKLIPLSRGALAVFSDFVNRIGTMIGNVEDERIKSTLSKIEGAAARMSLTLHAVEAGELGEEIPEASMLAGTELALWYAFEAIRVFGAADTDASALLATKVLEYIKRKGPVAIRDLVSGIRDIANAEEAERICRELAEQGQVIIDGKTVSAC